MFTLYHDIKIYEMINYFHVTEVIIIIIFQIIFTEIFNEKLELRQCGMYLDGIVKLKFKDIVHLFVFVFCFYILFVRWYSQFC